MGLVLSGGHLRKTGKSVGPSLEGPEERNPCAHSQVEPPPRTLTPAGDTAGKGQGCRPRQLPLEDYGTAFHSGGKEGLRKLGGGENQACSGPMPSLSG